MHYCAGPEDAALIAESAETVQTMIDQLTPDQRRVVALRLAGLTGPEIAVVLGRGAKGGNSDNPEPHLRLHGPS